MELSKHAEIRSQQRSISKEAIDMIIKYGTPTRKPGNAFEYKLHKKKKNQVISDLKHMINMVDKCTRKAVLVDAEDINKIITVYNQF
jgi:hypothetical protein